MHFLFPSKMHLPSLSPSLKHFVLSTVKAKLSPSKLRQGNAKFPTGRRGSLITTQRQKREDSPAGLEPHKALNSPKAACSKQTLLENSKAIFKFSSCWLTKHALGNSEKRGPLIFGWTQRCKKSTEVTIKSSAMVNYRQPCQSVSHVDITMR